MAFKRTWQLSSRRLQGGCHKTAVNCHLQGSRGSACGQLAQEKRRRILLIEIEILAADDKERHNGIQWSVVCRAKESVREKTSTLGAQALS
ncbi:hypothetical protein Bpfe_019264 [Biomphalaria pfeifferi]|uniref:Uncharacterized protein n=1 Tax=Biomphalaria pfeifferi TaxID=112525 RepID=A0AAD8F5E5_BIOPF|nr:hypothetical protein Bpfe_019264 [Biomphalaria pfeifferi]